jgi:hypothetical protein
VSSEMLWNGPACCKAAPMSIAQPAAAAKRATRSLQGKCKKRLECLGGSAGMEEKV